jgi:hypothetical protein
MTFLNNYCGRFGVNAIKSEKRSGTFQFWRIVSFTGKRGIEFFTDKRRSGRGGIVNQGDRPEDSLRSQSSPKRQGQDMLR